MDLSHKGGGGVDEPFQILDIDLAHLSYPNFGLTGE